MDHGQDIHTAAAVAADPLLAEAAVLYAHPAFPLAVRDYAAGLVQFRRNSRLINKLGAHEVRLRAIGYLLHLSALSRSDGGDGGVSYGQLLELCVERRGEVSPRVLKTMLALMDFAGFLESWRRAADRRVTVYRPTPRMLAYARQWFHYAAVALDRMAPALRREQRLASDADFLNRLLVDAGRDHAEGPPAERMPEFIGYFGGREGAGAVVARLTLAAIDGEPVASRAALAREFGLSKTQVSQVIAEGVQIGYLTLDSASLPVLTPKLDEAHRRWISIELAFYARHMR